MVPEIQKFAKFLNNLLITLNAWKSINFFLAYDRASQTLSNKLVNKCFWTLNKNYSSYRDPSFENPFYPKSIQFNMFWKGLIRFVNERLNKATSPKIPRKSIRLIELSLIHFTKIYKTCLYTFQRTSIENFPVETFVVTLTLLFWIISEYQTRIRPKFS